MSKAIPAQLKKPKSLSEQAAEEIRSRIVRGEFELGTPLCENDLANELGIGPTPLRQALHQLKIEGMVSVLDQGGSYVFDMTAGEMTKLGELREIMEVAALRLAVLRNLDPMLAQLRTILKGMRLALDAGDGLRYRTLDGEFHRLFFAHCGNPYIADCYESFAYRIQALRARLSTDHDLNELSLAGHEKIVSLIAFGQVDEAVIELIDHMSDTTTRSAAWKADGDPDASLGQAVRD